MKLSIVPEIINSQQIKIFNEHHVPISICSPSSFKFNNQFKNPFILIDNFEKDKFKNVEITRINIEDVQKFGYRLVSIHITPGMSRNYPRQAKLYILEEKNNPIPKSEILHKLPDNHFIEYDLENKRLRILGKNSYPYIRNENASKWIELKKDGR